MIENLRRTQNGRFSPLRYPGGKGKIARFIENLIRLNNLSDGRYVEPYAGGAAIAWQLLLTGVVRRVSINDINLPVYSFWKSVLNYTDEICAKINDTPVTIENWQRCKHVFNNQCDFDNIELGFSFFYLNRTNRSGILNGGVIGGKSQLGAWKIDARYNKEELIGRIKKIAQHSNRIELHNSDAIEFLKINQSSWRKDTLVYIDPPYFQKGRYLYHDAYQPDDHQVVGNYIKNINKFSWVVSYDDVLPIHEIYEKENWLQYTLNYSARNVVRGREAMFFSPDLVVPELFFPLVEINRDFSEIKKSARSRF